MPLPIMPLPITGIPLLQQLVKAGLVLPTCQRAILDIPADNVVRIYSQNVGDNRLLEINLPDLLKECNPVHVVDPDTGFQVHPRPPGGR